MFVQDLQIYLNYFINNNLRTLIFLETFIDLLCIIDYVTLRIMFSSFFVNIRYVICLAA